MAGIGDESAHPVLGATGLIRRGLRGGQCPLDLGQHSVEGQGELARLGPRITQGHTAFQLAVGDRHSCLLDLHQWSKAPVDDPVPCGTESDQDANPDRELQPDQRVQGRLNIGEVDRDGDQVTIGPAHRHRPPLNTGVPDRSDGHRNRTHVIAGRQDRLRLAVVDRHPDLAVVTDPLDVEIRRRPGRVGPGVGGDRLTGLLGPGSRRIGQRLVHPGDQGVPQDRGDRDTRGQQAGGRQHEHGRDQPDPKGQNAPVNGVPSARSRLRAGCAAAVSRRCRSCGADTRHRTRRR